MDLKGGQITIREILQNQEARAVLEEELPAFINHPLIKNAHNMTLDYVERITKPYISQKKLMRIKNKLLDI